MILFHTSSALPPPPLRLLQDASLFLDFDGTLVSIAARPDAIAVEEHLKNLLARLQDHLHGRMAIVSGRAAADVMERLADSRLAIAGSHGAELCRPGDSPDLGTISLDAASQALLEELLAAHPGVLSEHKPKGLALHYRQAPEAEPGCRDVAAQIARRTGLALLPGKMVIELRMPGSDKGTAVAALMQEDPMRGGRPIFIGDDETDEAGFRAATARNGAGILVGDSRTTHAQFRLPDVDATLAWLEAALQAGP